METLWNVVEALIDTRLRASLQFHDFLHGLRARRWTWKAIMETNLVQELSSVYHDPLLLVFLGFWKVYDTVLGNTQSINSMDTARDLVCADSWRLSGTTNKWCQDRMAIIGRPSQPHGGQCRAVLCIQHSSKWLCKISSGHGWS